jgi:hypothetical protein
MRHFLAILVIVAVVMTACDGGGETPVAVTPTFSPAGGTYTAAQSVTISTTTPGATIYYTTDDSTPTTASAVYGGPVGVSASATLKAIASAPGYTASAVGTAIYVININHTFDGTWVVCRNDLGADFREVFTIDGASGSFNLISYDTVDVSCDGDGMSDTPAALTAVYGDQVTAGLGTGTVQATKVDVRLVRPPGPPSTLYTLLYREMASTPGVIHLGDDSGTLDGSTPALRPVNLQTVARALQTAPMPGDLTGEWRSCPAAADGNILKLDAASGTFDATKYTGTCEAGTVKEHVTGTYTLATPVYASFGATTVTAFAVDLNITAPFVGKGYTTFWVDTQASPRRLVRGDDALHGMDGSAASLRPRVLSTNAYVKQ